MPVRKLWRDVDAPCRGGGLGTIGDSELGQDVADVHADSLLADERVLGDTPVAEPVGEKREHLPFSLGEAARRAGLRAGLRAAAGPGRGRRDIPYHLPLGVTAAEWSIRLDEQLLAEDRKWRAVSRSADFAEPYPAEFPPDTAG
jgi:hypothetical protein